jgi:hypothetical protein
MQAAVLPALRLMSVQDIRTHCFTPDAAKTTNWFREELAENGQPVRGRRYLE